MLKTCIITFLSIFLIGCGATMSNIKQDVVTNLDKNDGYLLLGIKTDENIREIVISGKRRIIISAKDLKSGKSYFLVNLPAGRYEFARIDINSWIKHRDLDEDFWSFEVKDKTISYVGDLSYNKGYFWFMSGQLKLKNNSSIALEYLENNYPNLLAEYGVQYYGTGEDSFFNLVRPVTKEVK